MATSGASQFQPAVAFLLTQAYRHMGVIAEGEALTGDQYADALFQANALVTQWQAMGIHVWTQEEAILFLQKDQVQYRIGGTSVENCCAADDFAQDQLEQNAAEADTTITVAVPEAFSDGDNIGVVLDSNFTHWTTVADVTGDVVTLDAALPGPASAGNLVWVYTTRIIKPLRIPDARLLTWGGYGGTAGAPQFGTNNEIPMFVLARQQYMQLPLKRTPGVPTQFYYSPRISDGELYVWPMPNFSAWAMRFTWYRPIQYYLTPENTSDFPPEWANALSWNIAEQLMLTYSVPPERAGMISQQAAMQRDMVESWDRDSEDIQFGMDYWRNGTGRGP